MRKSGELLSLTQQKGTDNYPTTSVLVSIAGGGKRALSITRAQSGEYAYHSSLHMLNGDRFLVFWLDCGDR